MADDLTGLGAQGFERLCRALAVCELGPGIEVFGDGPDGGRDVSFHGRLRYPSPERPWDGYGVVQAKYKAKITSTRHDTAWLLGQVKAEMDAWTNPDKRRVRDGRRPEYLIFATNVSLSGVPGRGGKDRVNDLIRSYIPILPLKDWQFWDASQITTLLDRHPDVRRAFAALITPNELITALHDRLMAPQSVVVEIPPTRIQPGQPGNEAAFTAAFAAAGGADRLGHALGEVDPYGAGLLQHFDGGTSGEPAVICALVGQPAVAMARPVWDELCAVGGGQPNGGVLGVGYPAAGQGTNGYIGTDAESVHLVGGRWGRLNDGTRRGRLIRRSGAIPRWEPEIVFDSEATKDRNGWTSRPDKMDLRLRVAARIPLVADSLRITEAGRERMLGALVETGITDIIERLAKRYSLEPTTNGWLEIEEPDGYNDSRFAAYEAVVAGNPARPAVRGRLWLTLPDRYATEVSAIADLEVDFDAIRPVPAAIIPAEFRIKLSELAEFFAVGWHVTTLVLPLAASEDPATVPPAGAPRLELYVQNQHPEGTGDARVLQTLDMVDLTLFGRTRRKQIRDLSVGVTTPLDLSRAEIHSLVRQAMRRLAEDFAFTGATSPVPW